MGVFLAAVDQVSNYAECKKSCEDEAKCRGVTFYGTVNNPGSCVHFSTECKNTRPSEDGDTIAATVTKECDAPAACKVEKNFIYRGDAITPKPSGKFPTAKDCNAECLKRINCKFWWWSKNTASQTTCFLLKNFKSKVDSSMFNFHSVVAGNRCEAAPKHPAKPAEGISCWKKLCNSCEYSGSERRVSTGGTLAACQASCAADPKCKAIDFGKGSRAKQCYHNYDSNGSGHGHGSFNSYINKCPAKPAKPAPKTGPSTGPLLAFQHLTTVIGEDDCLYVAGYNAKGAFADGTKKNSHNFKWALSDVKTAAAGYEFIVALKKDGSVMASGYNGHGELGDGSTTDRLYFVEVIDEDVVHVSAGFYHSVAMKQDGSLWATGYNNKGQLGDGTATDRKYFMQVISGGVKDVSSGTHSTLVLKQDGTVWATGYNNYGQLGDGTVTVRLGFVEVIDADAKAISSGTQHAMVIKQDGSLWAAGYNGYGQLGDKTKTKRQIFVKVVDEGVKEVSVGHDQTVLINDKNELCVSGYNGHGELGTGDTTALIGFKCYPRPGPIIQPGAIKGPSTDTLTADYQYTTFLGEDGYLYTTGYNGHGAFGDGSTTAATNFKTTIALSNVKAATGGYYHISVLKKDGSVWASGYNNYGQLGDGTVTVRHTYVKAIDDVVFVSAGYSHTVVIKDDNSLWGTGYNGHGELGDGTVATRVGYVKLIDADVKDVCTGDYTTLVIKKDGSLWATGYNNYGQLGDGTTADKHVFMQVISGGVVDVSAGPQSTMV